MKWVNNAAFSTCISVFNKTFVSRSTINYKSWVSMPGAKKKSLLNYNNGNNVQKQHFQKQCNENLIFYGFPLTKNPFIQF